MTTRIQNSQNCTLAYEDHQPDADSLIRLRDTLRRQKLSFTDQRNIDAVTRQIERINRTLEALDYEA